jgi:predicted N-acetyltransferase YhbS
LNNETDVERVVIKNYFNGAELDIVDLLNGVYGRWGDVEKWRHAYPDYPTFERDDVVMIEKDGRLVGHGGLHARTLEVKQGERVLAALLGDAAVREDHRGRGIYSKIVEKRLDIAKSRGAAFAFWWVLRDSVSYRTGKKFGFIEVNQTPVYIKILKPKKIL